ncbi:MAG: hypothetical protein HAW67_00555, partial [Endozoicomonadaceae bacterium]|nr:hypothetical protein [Endozoicomonadaceae bacterium]
EGRLSAVVGSEHVSHVCGIIVHPQGIRNITSGSSIVSIEGSPAAFVGSGIACGDTCGGTHASKTSIG